MVRLTKMLLISQKKMNAMFVDSLRIYVAGGAGGMGFPKFGGVGGNGGNVYVEGTQKINLKEIISRHPTKRISAGLGGHASVHRVLGEPGKDAIIPSPVGIAIVSDAGAIIGEINKPGEKLLVARGGKGGCPLNQFCGQKGEKLSITLDLKLIADVGLVGFPNAGKSTLLKAISRASPRIAAYPFTTLCPQLGMLQYDDMRRITMADLPGLIEGAHQNIGLGHKFLKHVERTKMLLFVVDINGFILGHQYAKRTAIETIILLIKELELYREDLLDKPALLVLNKIDTDNASDLLPQLLNDIQNMDDCIQRLPELYRPSRILKFDGVIPISAKQKKGIDIVKSQIRTLLDTICVTNTMHHFKYYRPRLINQTKYPKLLFIRTEIYRGYSNLEYLDLRVFCKTNKSFPY